MSPEQARAEKAGSALRHLLAGRRTSRALDGSPAARRNGWPRGAGAGARRPRGGAEHLCNRRAAGSRGHRDERPLRRRRRSAFRRHESWSRRSRARSSSGRRSIDAHVLETVIQEDSSPREEEPRKVRQAESGPLMVVTGAGAAAPAPKHTPLGDTTGLGRGLEVVSRDARAARGAPRGGRCLPTARAGASCGDSSAARQDASRSSCSACSTRSRSSAPRAGPGKPDSRRLAAARRGTAGRAVVGLTANPARRARRAARASSRSWTSTRRWRRLPTTWRCKVERASASRAPLLPGAAIAPATS